MTNLSAIIIIALLVGFGSGWGINGWRLGSEVTNQELLRSKDAEAAAVMTTKVVKEALERQKRDLDISNHITSNFKEATDRAQTLDNTIITGVDRGTTRLLVPTKCPASGGPVFGSGSTITGTDGASPELDPTARPNYYALRRSLEKVRNQLVGLQDYVRSVCAPDASGADRIGG